MSDPHRDGQAAARHEAVIAELLARVQAEVTGAAALVDVAEDEIEQAAARHRQAADDLFHTFPLLLPAFGAQAWSTEFVYRAHCRELLERVAAGEDTRPGTAVECVLVMRQVALAVPLNGPAAGFYLRMWRLAFPDHELSDRAQHYEALERDRIDDIERKTRKKLAVAGRVLRAIECDGYHNGESAACKYRTEAAP